VPAVLAEVTRTLEVVRVTPDIACAVVHAQSAQGCPMADIDDQRVSPIDGGPSAHIACEVEPGRVLGGTIMSRVDTVVTIRLDRVA
jgi:hypothetical protein